MRKIFAEAAAEIVAPSHRCQGSYRKDPAEFSPAGLDGAKIKHWMRTAQERTIDEVWRHIGHLTTTIEPPECNNYLVGAGYASANM
jgi:hypothetical protein